MLKNTFTKNTFIKNISIKSFSIWNIFAKNNYIYTKLFNIS